MTLQRGCGLCHPARARVPPHPGCRMAATTLRSRNMNTSRSRMRWTTLPARVATVRLSPPHPRLPLRNSFIQVKPLCGQRSVGYITYGHLRTLSRTAHLGKKLSCTVREMAEDMMGCSDLGRSDLGSILYPLHCEIIQAESMDCTAPNITWRIPTAVPLQSPRTGSWNSQPDSCLSATLRPPRLPPSTAHEP